MFGNSVHFRCDFHYICMKMTGNKGTPPALMKYSCECNTFRPQASIVACPQDSFMMTPLAEKATTTKKNTMKAAFQYPHVGLQFGRRTRRILYWAKIRTFGVLKSNAWAESGIKKGSEQAGVYRGNENWLNRKFAFDAKYPSVGVAVFSNASVFLWTHKEYRLSFESLFFVH